MHESIGVDPHHYHVGPSSLRGPTSGVQGRPRRRRSPASASRISSSTNSTDPFGRQAPHRRRNSSIPSVIAWVAAFDQTVGVHHDRVVGVELGGGGRRRPGDGQCATERRDAAVAEHLDRAALTPPTAADGRPVQ